MLATRPDLSFSVSILSIFLDKYTEKYWIAAKRILRYLKSTANNWLTLGNIESKYLEGYSDASFLGDLEDRKSTTGIFIFLYGSPILWKTS